MIIFLTTAEHPYTLERLREEQARAFDMEVVPYEQVLSARQFPVASYVFTDIDRLPMKMQLQAAGLYRQLVRSGSGCQALNDPARVRSRYGLLRALYRHGLNAFNAYRVDEAVAPQRFPVFIRFEQAHDRPLSELLPDQAALDRAVAERLEQGVPEHAMLVVEYCAEPIADGVFRRQAAYRVRDRILAGESVHEDRWCVKEGSMGVASAAHYEEELAAARELPHAEHLMRAFEIGGVEYGRVDYSVVDGCPQVYEINTNPRIGRVGEHPSQARVQAHALMRESLLHALREFDRAGARA